MPVRREGERGERDAAHDGAGFARPEVHGIEQGEGAVVEQPVADERAGERKGAREEAQGMRRSGRARARGRDMWERGNHACTPPRICIVRCFRRLFYQERTAHKGSEGKITRPV